MGETFNLARMNREDGHSTTDSTSGLAGFILDAACSFSPVAAAVSASGRLLNSLGEQMALHF